MQDVCSVRANAAGRGIGASFAGCGGQSARAAASTSSTWPGHLHLAPDPGTVPVGVDQEGRAVDAHVCAAVHRLLAPDAVALDDVAALVREQHDAEAVLVAEPVVAFHAVLGDAEHHRVRRLEVGALRGEAQRLGGAARRCRPWDRSRARPCGRGSRPSRTSPPPSRGRVKSGAGWPASIVAMGGLLAIAGARYAAAGAASGKRPLWPARRAYTAAEPMRLDEFDFDLPEELIALRPARPRPAARLLVARAATRSPIRRWRGSATGWSRATCWSSTTPG